MADQIHVVPHFHWDREWYFTAEESKILLVNDMEEILEMLEKNPDYPYFVLDGQTAVLEDYLSVKPENRERLQVLVQQGKLIIGPWYTQTDEMVVGGESIVRNLLYGKKDCEELGPRMMIGYLPDSFGQSARLPQILNGFGIRRCMFWRGTSERMGTTKTEFLWKGDDGGEVIVQLLPLGYAIGKYLPEEENALRERMDKYLPVLDRGATTDHILLPNGHDQMPVQKNIFKVMDQIERCYPGRKTILSRYEDVFDQIEKQEHLDSLTGEFLDGKYMRVHRSIYSSRADLKSANTRIENKITHILEPLAAMAFHLGFVYHHGLIEAIWKELLKNHAHDSIGCCCSDKVHREIVDPGLIDRQIVHYGNYDPFVKYQIVFEGSIPSMGYQTYLIRECAQEPCWDEGVKKEDYVMENSWYQVTVEHNGTLTIQDKRNGEEYRNVPLVEDGSDDGDGYDYSPVENDYILTSEDAEADIEVRDYGMLSRAHIGFTMKLPENLESRKKRIKDGEMDVVFQVELKQDSPVIEVTMEVDNRARDHRVRVCIPNNLGTEASVSDNQFGTIRRPAADLAMEVWEQEKWSERPDSIYPFLSFVRQDNDRGLAVLTNSVREYELTGEGFDQIALTIFRSVGVLGKEELVRRPGRPSGIRMETPDSQMQGPQVYEFALTSDMEHGAQRAAEYTTPLVTYNKMPYNAMKLNVSDIQTPYSYSLLQIDNPDITVSALKKEENGEGILLRVYNATDSVQKGEMVSELQAVEELMLDETKKCGFSGRELVLKPNQIRTILFQNGVSGFSGKA